MASSECDHDYQIPEGQTSEEWIKGRGPHAPFPAFSVAAASAQRQWPTGWNRLGGSPRLHD